MRNVILAATLAMAMGLPARAAPRRVYPQYEGLDTQVYLTVTPTPKRERYGSGFYAIERAALMAKGPANDARVVPFFVKDTGARHGLAIAVNPAEAVDDYDLLIRARIESLEATDHTEGYALRVFRGDGQVQAELTANTVKGIQHGLQSLRQLMVRWKGPVIVREAELVDWPTLKLRFVKRVGGYWSDNVVRWKMNGTTVPVHPKWGTQPEVMKKFMDNVAEQARRRNVYLLAMVGMGNLYEGRDEAMQGRADWYVALYRAGVTHLAVMNDDRMTLADPLARQRFGTYYGAQVETVNRISKALRAAGYRERLGYMPNHYYGDHVNDQWIQAGKGKLPEQTALFWAGTGTPGPEVTRKHLETVRKQSGLKHVWFYANWPQCAGPAVSDSYGAARRRDFGRGELTELVTVSTTTYPRSFPTSFITVCDLLWNPEAYDPDRALRRATKEVVDPQSFPAFYRLFKYIDTIAPLPKKASNTPMYLADDPKQRRAIIASRSAMLDKLVADCLGTPAAEPPRAKQVLEKMVNTQERFMKRLVAEEARDQNPPVPRRIVCPKVDKAPVLDGDLDDPVWEKAALADKFTDIRATKPAPHQTTVRLLRHKDKLYFAVRCEETHLKDKEFLQIDFDYPLTINAEPGGYLWWAESIELFLDPGRDRRRVFQTMLNPWGLKQCFTYDTVKYGYHNIENQLNVNYPVFGKTHILKDAWVLEFAIPVSAFEPEGLDGEWGFNVARTRRIRAGDGMKYSSWTPLGWGFQDASSFGIMTFQK